MKQILCATIMVFLVLSCARADDPWVPRDVHFQSADIPLVLPSLIVPLPPASPDPPDSTPGIHSRLMPQSSSWMERTLWDESGLVRKIGIAGDLTPEVRRHEL